MPHTTTHPFIGWMILHVIFKANLHSSAVWWTILFGSMTPDFSYLFWYSYYKVQGHSEETIFNDDNNNKIWNIIIDYSHSIVVSLFISIIMYIIYYALLARNANLAFEKKKNNDSTINSVELHNMHNVMSSNMNINEVSIACDEEKNERDIGRGHSLYLLPDDIKNDDEILMDQKVKAVTNSKTCRNCWCELQTLFILLSYFWTAICIHCIIDFPLHVDDARSQLLPFTKYIFHSPLSYWNYHHYGYISAPILSLVVQIGTIWMYQHKKHDWKQQSKYLLWFMVMLLIVNVTIESITFVKAIIHIFKLIV